MRKPCRDCTRKHLAQALVISHELPWYADAPDDMHLWVCVGHLAEAEAQVYKLDAYIADKIREQRLLLMREGASAATKLDINLLISMVCDIEEPAASPTTFGSEIPDITESSE